MTMSSYVPALDCWLMIRDLPDGARGFVTRDGNNTTYIIISSKLSEMDKLTTLMHEMVHYIRGDLDSEEPRCEIESNIIMEK